MIQPLAGVLALILCCAACSWHRTEALYDSRSFAMANVEGAGQVQDIRAWGFVDTSSDGWHFLRGNVRYAGHGPVLEGESDNGEPNAKLGWASEIPGPIDFLLIQTTTDPDRLVQTRLVLEHDLGAGFSMGGFCDVNSDERIVAELQVRYTLVDPVRLFVEPDYNAYLEHDKFGVGVGVQCAW